MGRRLVKRLKVRADASKSTAPALSAALAAYDSDDDDSDDDASDAGAKKEASAPSASSWEPQVDAATGATYWWHRETNETTWTDPTAAAAAMDGEPVGVRPDAAPDASSSKKTAAAEAARSRPATAAEEGSASSSSSPARDAAAASARAVLGRVFEDVRRELRTHVDRHAERRRAAGHEAVKVPTGSPLVALDRLQRARLTASSPLDGSVAPAADAIAAAVALVDDRDAILGDANWRAFAALGALEARFADWYAGALPDDVFASRLREMAAAMKKTAGTTPKTTAAETAGSASSSDGGGGTRRERGGGVVAEHPASSAAASTAINGATGASATSRDAVVDERPPATHSRDDELPPGWAATWAPRPRPNHGFARPHIADFWDRVGYLYLHLRKALRKRATWSCFLLKRVKDESRGGMFTAGGNGHVLSPSAAATVAVLAMITPHCLQSVRCFWRRETTAGPRTLLWRRHRRRPEDRTSSGRRVSLPSLFRASLKRPTRAGRQPRVLLLLPRRDRPDHLAPADVVASPSCVESPLPGVGASQLSEERNTYLYESEGHPSGGKAQRRLTAVKDTRRAAEHSATRITGTRSEVATLGDGPRTAR